ncbi:MAG: iron-sulfur cluster assembly accessory protein [Candidatus Kapabacteria bacterium]|nr:iron-sulfur cluster assembly accessory protein [Candidatus Kapabacteria bacterium]
MENIIIDSQITGADDTDLIQITPAAIAAFRSAIEVNKAPETYFLRFKSESAGCSGMNFSIEFDYIFKPETDREFDVDGIRLVTDRKTLFYLMGITLDFIDDEGGRGFVFRGFRNFKTCGCHEG